MEKIKTLLAKYGLYILVVGIVLLIIATSWRNNLPSPYFLSPREAQTQFYGPMKVTQILKGVGIVGILIGAFATINNFVSFKKNDQLDTDPVTKAIASNLFGNQGGPTSIIQNLPIAGTAIGGYPEKPTSSVVEVHKDKFDDGYQYFYRDEDDTLIVGINPILTHFINKGYRIVNTIEVGSDSDRIMQIIIEK